MAEFDTSRSNGAAKREAIMIRKILFSAVIGLTLSIAYLAFRHNGFEAGHREFKSALREFQKTWKEIEITDMRTHRTHSVQKNAACVNAFFEMLGSSGVPHTLCKCAPDIRYRVVLRDSSNSSLELYIPSTSHWTSGVLVRNEDRTEFYFTPNADRPDIACEACFQAGQR